MPIQRRGRRALLVAAVAAKSPLVVAGSKLAINYAIDHSTTDAVQQMTLLQSAIFDIDEMASAIEAWKNKQAASFDALAALTPVLDTAVGIAISAQPSAPKLAAMRETRKPPAAGRGPALASPVRRILVGAALRHRLRRVSPGTGGLRRSAH